MFECGSGESEKLVVLLYGYKGDEYWLIRVPLGSEWGYMGGMRVAMEGNCGIEHKIGFILFDQVERPV